MTTMPLMPRGGQWTPDDLAGLPDDGNRYELIDGALVVTPAPLVHHQRVLLRLFRELDAACPPGLEVLVAPVDVRLGPATVVQPDLLVAPTPDPNAAYLEAVPLLVAEVLSPSTRSLDLVLKRDRYERAGCPAYWVLDPAGAEFLAWELADGRYAEAARATGGAVTLTRPYPLTLDVDALFAGDA